MNLVGRGPFDLFICCWQSVGPSFGGVGGGWGSGYKLLAFCMALVF